jgi:hypothetical protein
MRDTSSAANHRRPDRNGLRPDPVAGSGSEAEEGTWFESVAVPPVDTPLIALVPVPREAD